MKKTQDIYQASWAFIAITYGGGKYSSIPLPQIVEGKIPVLLMMLGVRTYIPPLGRSFPPSAVIMYDIHTGELHEFIKVTPADFGQRHSSDEIIDQHNIGEVRTLNPEESEAFVKASEASSKAFEDLRSQLFTALDALLPDFFAGNLSVAPEVRAAAAEFERLFPLVREAWLVPYYAHVGKDFFIWLHRVRVPLP